MPWLIASLRIYWRISGELGSGALLECGDSSPLWFVGKRRQVGALQNPLARLALRAAPRGSSWRYLGQPHAVADRIGAFWSAVTRHRFGFWESADKSAHSKIR